MIKLLLTGIWGVLLLSGSVYFFHSSQAASTNVEEAEEVNPFFGKLETIALDTMSVVYISQNKVQGYIILEVAFIVDADKNKKITVPLKYLVQNSVNNTFLKNDDINITRLDSFDPDEIEKRLAEDLNEKIGEKVVSEVLIQRIDFMSSDDVRDNRLKGG